MLHMRVAVWVCVIAVCAAVARVSGSMNKVAPGIFVGNQHSAGDMATLKSKGVQAILNVAWDLDIRYETADYTGSLADYNEHLESMQYAKAGLVDGPGNSLAGLASAVLQLHQLLSSRGSLLPSDAALYPLPVRSILVHCHSGQSRSVTVAATYLTLSGAYASYDSALRAVKAARGLEDNTRVPAPELTELAKQLVASGFSLSLTGGGGSHTSPPPPSPSPPPSSSSSSSTSSSTSSASPTVGTPSSGSKTKSSLIVFFVVLTAIVVFVGTVLIVARRKPDSPLGRAVSSLGSRLPCSRSGGLSSAYSMSSPPDYDF